MSLSVWLQKASFKIALLAPVLVIMVLPTLTTGCKEEAVINDPDEYYVKFDVNSSTIYSGGKLEVTVTDEQNQSKTFIVNQKALWEITIGPVQKGFEASMFVQALGNTQNQLKLYSNIYVSKNTGPFAIKKTDGSDSPRDHLEISYTIDY